MNSETSFLTPPVFNGENYQAWAIRMTVHLEALDLWEAVEEDYEVTPLGDNPTVNQMKHHKENKTRKVKAKASLFSAVSPSTLTRIMQMKSVVEIWEYLTKEYQGNERVQNMQVMNLIQEFEIKRMKESETIKDYTDQLLDLANKVRLFGKDFADERIVQNILVILPEKYETTISSLENSKDLSSVTLAELVKAWQALEERRLMRKEGSIEGGFQANSLNSESNKEGKRTRSRGEALITTIREEVSLPALIAKRQITLNRSVGGDQTSSATNVVN
ncbi:hypothetical protein KY290_036426 [Solanum tuberosum]|uniref:DUF4219 domain-containing protein n=1 Tax=Solanum tuberosum TaxID=4113 RepID=A0ABQ7TT42_SOLTU|nr:hypothetical protein KY285_035732 [Solanum tuberosum]KAH0737721.1 hypothetical protein KY290_036426 [Solanum tuberosum]